MDTKKGDDVGIKGNLACALSHQQDGNRVGAQSAQDGGAEHLCQQGGHDFFAFGEGDAAQQCAEHTAGKCHQAAQTQQVAQQAGAKGDPDPIPGTQQHRAQDVDHVLHRRTFAGKDREGEEAADYGNCAEDACDGQFTDVCFFHYDHSL